VYSGIFGKDINEDTIPLCYFFYGEEPYLAYKFLDDLKEALASHEENEFNVEKLDLEDSSWMDVIDMARTLPVFISSRRIIVVEMKKSKNELINSKEKKLLQAYFSSSVKTKSVIVIICPEKLRKNSALVSFFSSFPAAAVTAIEVKPLKGRRLESWLDKKLEEVKKYASDGAKKRLTEIAGNDLRRLNNEIEKIATFVGEKERIELDDVNQVSGWVKSFVVWEITDSLEQKNYKQGVIVLNKLLKKEGIPPQNVLGIIARFFRELLLAKLWLKEQRMDKKAVFRKLRPQIQENWRDLYERKFNELFFLIDRMPMKELNGFLKELEEIDVKIKTSDLPFQPLIEGFLYRYCRR
jgi:DNA polymerase III delta subunit